MLDREELSSDEDERPERQIKSFIQIKAEVERFINKDLSSLDEAIDKLYEEIKIEA